MPFLITLAWDLFLLKTPFFGPLQPAHHYWLLAKGARKRGIGAGNPFESTDEFGQHETVSALVGRLYRDRA